MLSALPNQADDTLRLFKLALEMKESQTVNIPQSLKDYFIQVLLAAKALAKEPSNMRSNTYPEAFELALDILSNDIFSVVDDVDDFEKITPELAKQILENMEAQTVHQNGFSPFAGLSS